MKPSPRPLLLNRLADRVGMSAAWLCALHCALWPVALAALPAAGLAAWDGWEAGFVAFAAVLGIASLATGWRRHRIATAFWFLVPGLALLAFAVLRHNHENENVILHAVLMTAGGVLVGVAHLVNLRLGHGHVHDATCGHLAAHHGHDHADTPVGAGLAADPRVA